MTEQIDVLEDQYRLKLEHACKTWEVAHPEEAKAIRETVRQQFAIAGQPDPEIGSLRWQIFEAAVVEAIRVKKGWRSVRQWMLDKKPSAPFIAPKITPPAVEREDRKSKAAGE